MGPGGSGALVRSADVHLHDQVPVLVLHVLESDIAENAGIVDEDIDAAERINGSLDDGLAVLDRIIVGDGLAAGSADLLDDDVCSLLRIGPSVSCSS